MEDMFLIPSPYLIPASGQIQRASLGGTAAMGEIISMITFPPDLETNPYWESDVGRLLLSSRRYVAAEFIRRYFDKRLDWWIMPRTWKKEVKDRFYIEARLWGETWKMIEQLYSRSMLVPDVHPAITFYKVVNECALLQPYLQLLSHEEIEGLTATAAARAIQSENKRLQRLGTECVQDIPFDRTTVPVTWQLIEQCRRLASISDDFRDQYLAVIESRMTFASHLRGERPKIYSNSSRKTERRGRKPKGFTGKS
jgi:hypothetical protein